MSQGDIIQAIASLTPGDALNFAAGDYSGITLDLQLTGTAQNPITVRGDTGGARPRIIANADAYQEAIRVRPGSAFLIIEHLHLTMTGNDVQAGVYFDEGVHDITIRDCEISDVTGIGIQMQTKSDIHDVLIDSNHIHHTGTNLQQGSNGGQGFTAGGFGAGTATTGVYGLVLRHNVVHDTRGQEGDCMKFMYGVYASVMEDNVAYDCPRGVAQEENYGLTSYGSGPAHYQNAAESNVIRRNLLLRTGGVQAGEKNVAIWAGPGTTVENNVIITTDIGIAARQESEVSNLRNLRVLHNTIYDVTDHAFSIRGTQNSDDSVVVANNVFITVDGSAFGYRWPDGMGGSVAEANFFTGQDYAEVSEPAMIRLNDAPTAVFVNPSTTVPGADFMLVMGGPLVDVGSTVAGTADDFDLTSRPQGSGVDVGAYEEGGDPAEHWSLDVAFKGSTGTGGTSGAGGSGGTGGAAGSGGSGGSGGTSATGGTSGAGGTGTGASAGTAGSGASPGSGGSGASSGSSGAAGASASAGAAGSAGAGSGSWENDEGSSCACRTTSSGTERPVHLALLTLVGLLFVRRRR